jgi:hypothetical protein
MDLADFYRIVHPTAAQYTFFSAALGTFSKINHILEHRPLSKFKKIEIPPCIISDHNAIKLDLKTKTTAENKPIIGGRTTHCTIISGI